MCSILGNTTNTVKLSLAGRELAGITSLYAWRTVLPHGPVFTSETPVRLNDGTGIVTLAPRSVLTLTTTTGQR